MYQCRIYLMMLSAMHNHQWGKGKGESSGYEIREVWGQKTMKGLHFLLSMRRETIGEVWTEEGHELVYVLKGFPPPAMLRRAGVGGGVGEEGGVSKSMSSKTSCETFVEGNHAEIMVVWTGQERWVRGRYLKAEVKAWADGFNMIMRESVETRRMQKFFVMNNCKDGIVIYWVEEECKSVLEGK